MTEMRVVDRCDVRACTAQALVRVVIAGSSLDFCAHDFRAQEAGLIKAGAVIVLDRRAELTQKPAAPV